MDFNDGAVDHGVLHVGVFGDGIEDAFEDIAVNGAERSPIFGTIRCPIFCALSDSRPCGYPVAALPSSSFTGALSIPALRLLLSR